MKSNLNTITSFFRPTLRAHRPEAAQYTKFCRALMEYRERISEGATEENLKFHIMSLLKGLYPDQVIEQQGAIDFVIRIGKSASPAGVLVEAKRSSNKQEMVRKNDLNRKALHELVLYFMRERKAGNTNLLSLIICSEREFFVFRASDFEKIFWGNKKFRKSFLDWAAGRLTSSDTSFFYSDVVKPFIGKLDSTFEVAHIDISKFLDDNTYEMPTKSGIVLMKGLGPHCLLQSPLQNDSNSLNKSFYTELLHIIGLQEEKRVIKRAKKPEPGSLLENTLRSLDFIDAVNSKEAILRFGSNVPKRKFSIALELCLTWVNRILFLKLLEAQVSAFNGDSVDYLFLNDNQFRQYSGMNELFFRILALPQKNRPNDLKNKFKHVPYLNSSLFEPTDLEIEFLQIDGLKTDLNISYLKRTVLRDENGKPLSGKSHGLDYLLSFLSAFDFGSPNGGDLRPDDRSIINAAVLGLIFEKINGYQDGAIFTPGFITMHMAQTIVETTVLQKFKKLNPNWTLNTITDLKNNITDRSAESLKSLNAVIDDVTICDPAVGSGHFLVSCLNELLALKSRLGILTNDSGDVLNEYMIEVDNDELVISNSTNGEPFRYLRNENFVNPTTQRAQETLFEQKRRLIEGSLFGVDINSNSVKICRLRLWIELLKSAFYTENGVGPLETLPNIDINIREGNAVLQRFQLDANLSQVFNTSKMNVGAYKALANEYRSTRDKSAKSKIEQRIEAIKSRFQAEGKSKRVIELQTLVRELEAEEGQSSLFVSHGEDEKKLDKLRTKITKAKAQLEQIEQSETFRSAFEWRFEFPNALDENGKFQGFDIVIANPPYIRIQGIAGEQELQKSHYENQFNVARGNYEFANLFFELAVRLLKKDGNGIFIFPHKMFNSKNGEALREYLFNERLMRKVWHFGASQIFDGVTTYTCIAMFGKTSGLNFDFESYPLGDDVPKTLGNDDRASIVEYEQIETASKLYGENNWIFFNDPKGYEIFEAIYTNSVRLEDVMSVYVGLQTSRDPIYVAEVLEETNTTYRLFFKGKSGVSPIPSAEFIVEKRFFKPFLLGRDVHRYAKLSKKRVVFFPYEREEDDIELVSLSQIKSDCPRTADYLEFYEAFFKARESGKLSKKGDWHKYIYEKNLDKFDQPKLVGMEICTTKPNVTVDRKNFTHSTTVYGYLLNGYELTLEAVAAILNSSICWWFLQRTGDTLASDSRRMKTEYLKPFPLPQSPDTKTTKLVEKLYVKHLKHDGKDFEIEREIDDAVGKLYGLTQDQINYIREDSGFVIHSSEDS